MDKKLNGFNNGRDTTDGVGGREPYVFITQEEINEKKNMKTVTLKSSAIITIDELNNIWYVSDIDSVLGKVDVNGKFIPVQGREFTSEMLNAISNLMSQINAKETQKNPAGFKTQA
jgi:ribosome assembly protein YihI (activator of Der GTPase)